MRLCWPFRILPAETRGLSGRNLPEMQASSSVLGPQLPLFPFPCPFRSGSFCTALGA